MELVEYFTSRKSVADVSLFVVLRARSAFLEKLYLTDPKPQTLPLI